jgi:fructokinase
MASETLYGGIEAGGTKFICALGSGPGQIVSETRIETTTPDDTLQHVVHFFRPAVVEKVINRIGIACFGPLDLDPRSSTYGFITATPKPGWSNTDIVGRLQRDLAVKVVLDTDVDGAALSESVWGAGQGLDPILYLTIGTGIGGGYVKDGQPLKGLLHPEMGHIRIPHDFQLDPFPGACPFHGDCFEGLASGPALQKRFGRPADEISDNDTFWEVEARYIALALQDFIMTISPRRIILGGGIMQRAFLFKMIQTELGKQLNGYAQHPVLLEHLDAYVVPPMLGGQAGVLGAIALARHLA